MMNKCKYCNGTGYLSDASRKYNTILDVPNEFYLYRYICPACIGAGVSVSGTSADHIYNKWTNIYSREKDYFIE